LSVTGRPSVRIDVERLDDRTMAVTVGNDPLGDGAAGLYDCVTGLIEGGTSRIVVEFAGSILNSKQIDALVRASGAAGEGAIAIVAPPGYIQQMLEVGEPGGPVLLADTREDALEALG
jgi:hypothetical protein